MGKSSLRPSIYRNQTSRSSTWDVPMVSRLFMDEAQTYSNMIIRNSPPSSPDAGIPDGQACRRGYHELFYSHVT